jgi:hypothetical protein
MPKLVATALVVLALLAPDFADAQGPGFVGCPAGQAIQGINFVTRRLVCTPVGGDTSALAARVATLEGQVATLDTALSAVQAELAGLQGDLDATTSALAAAQATIACMSRVDTDVFFVGCNVHVRSGAGTTEALPNGLGNLIIGYNEESFPGVPENRAGSHNLVVGPGHSYSSVGGFVAGRDNAVSGVNASVGGGTNNTASGAQASVSGGRFNAASGTQASVSGGTTNTASGPSASVSGGTGSTASGSAASVSGGAANRASGSAASVSGGQSNEASGNLASVSGGFQRSAVSELDWAAGSLFEDF